MGSVLKADTVGPRLVPRLVKHAHLLKHHQELFNAVKARLKFYYDHPNDV